MAGTKGFPAQLEGKLTPQCPGLYPFQGISPLGRITRRIRKYSHTLDIARKTIAQDISDLSGI